jgi:type II secretion system protein G
MTVRPLNSRLPVRRSAWIRGIGLGIGIVGLIPFFIYATGGDGTTADLERRAWVFAMPIGVSAFFFALWLAHPWRKSVRLPLVIAVFLVAWAYGHHRLIYQIGGPGSRLDRARRAAAQAEITELGEALERFKADTGQFPEGTNGLIVLIRQPTSNKRKGPYFPGIPLDPWGQSYRYKCPGEHNPSGFDLSAPTTANGNPVCNWKEDP